MQAKAHMAARELYSYFALKAWKYEFAAFLVPKNGPNIADN